MSFGSKDKKEAILEEQETQEQIDEESSESKDKESMNLQIDDDDYVESDGSYKNKGGHKHAGKTTGIATRSKASKSKMPLMVKVARNGAAIYGTYVDGMCAHLKKTEEAYKAEHSEKHGGIATMKEMVGTREVTFSECFEKANHEARMAELEKKQKKFAERKKRKDAVGNIIKSLGDRASGMADMGARRETNTLLAGRTDGTTAEIPTTEGAVAAANRARQAENIMNKSSGSEGMQYD